jgi:hypothetical protein
MHHGANEFFNWRQLKSLMPLALVLALPRFDVALWAAEVCSRSYIACWVLPGQAGAKSLWEGGWESAFYFLIFSLLVGS